MESHLPVYDAMRDAGLFRTLAPKAFGGLATGPAVPILEVDGKPSPLPPLSLYVSTAQGCFHYSLDIYAGLLVSALAIAVMRPRHR